MDINLIKKLLLEGKSGTEVGKIVGVSRQRINQIVKENKLFLNRKEYGLSLKKIKRKINQQIKWKRDKWILDDLTRAQHSKFIRKRQNCKSRNIIWDLELEDIVWPTHCPVFGLELDYFAESKQDNSPSFDKIIPERGYIKGNVNIISFRANRIKNDGNIEEHLKIVEYLKNNLQSS